jgi:hypothetical protein
MGLEFEAICQWWWTTREYEGGRGFSGFTDLKVEDDDLKKFQRNWSVEKHVKNGVVSGSLTILFL